MKKIILMLLVTAFILLTGSAYALTPFWQSGVALDNTGQILDGANVDVRITIYNSSNVNIYQQAFAGVTTD